MFPGASDCRPNLPLKNSKGKIVGKKTVRVFFRVQLNDFLHDLTEKI